MPSTDSMKANKHKNVNVVGYIRRSKTYWSVNNCNGLFPSSVSSLSEQFKIHWLDKIWKLTQVKWKWLVIHLICLYVDIFSPITMRTDFAWTVLSINYWEIKKTSFFYRTVLYFSYVVQDKTNVKYTCHIFSFSCRFYLLSCSGLFAI